MLELGDPKSFAVDANGGETSLEFATPDGIEGTVNFEIASAAGEDAPATYTEVQRDAPKIGATRADADHTLSRMRSRPNFGGYLRDSMYWAQLSALLLDGVILSAQELEAAIAALAYLQGRYGACAVVLYTDSTYVRAGISEWIERWVPR